MRYKILAAAAAAIVSCCALTASAQASTAHTQSGQLATESGQLPALPAFKLGYLINPGAKLGPGLIFLDPHQVVQGAHAGPEIITTKGKIVWYDPLPGGQSASNFQVQEYEGKPVLTWWQGTTGNPAFGAFSVGIGQGEDVIMDSHYKIIKILKASGGYEPDSHEFYITRSGDALMTAYKDVTGVNLTRVGGSADGTVIDSIVREVNIRTGKVILNWSALGHVPVTDSYALPLFGSSPWDYFHVNSISPAPNGDLLVSGRHTWALYEINPRNGDVVWTLGGKASSFTIGAGVHFAWQHDPRFVSNDEIQLFDNEAGVPYKASAVRSRALWIRLDCADMTASFVKQIVQPPNQPETESQGSVQTLPNGNVLVGWGESGTFSEYNAAGKMLMDARLPGAGTAVVSGRKVSNNWQAYRVFQDNWTGMPGGRPTVELVPHGATDTISVAWNGATQVTRWRILAGASRSQLHPIRTINWNGLITSAQVSARHLSYVRVSTAIGKSG